MELAASEAAGGRVRRGLRAEGDLCRAREGTERFTSENKRNLPLHLNGYRIYVTHQEDAGRAIAVGIQSAKSTATSTFTKVDYVDEVSNWHVIIHD